MKKILNLIALPILAVAFSSCLGSSESTMNGAGFGFIRTYEDGTNYANIDQNGSVLSLTSPDIQKEQRGTSGNIQYNLNMGSIFQGNIFLADHASITTTPTVRLLQWDATGSEEHVNAIMSLAVLSAVPSDLLGDRWLLGCSYRANKGDVMQILCFYDKENQTYKKGENQEEEISYEEDGRIILDLKFKIIKAEPEQGVPPVEVQVTEDFVIDMGQMRDELYSVDKTNFFTDGFKNQYAQVQFRFSREIISKDEAGNEIRKSVPDYIGGWIKEGEVNRNAYLMYFPKPE